MGSSVITMMIYFMLNIVEERGYVGQTTLLLKDRVKRHWEGAKGGDGSVLHEAMRKWDDDCFWDIVVLQNCYDQQELDACEIWWTNELSTRSPGIGYNSRREKFTSECSKYVSLKTEGNKSKFNDMSADEQRAFLSECGKRGARRSKELSTKTSQT